jgi:hypothetical protein
MKSVRRAILVGAAALAMAARTATPALADPAPGDCSTIHGNNLASSLCTTGFGMHRVVVVQRSNIPGIFFNVYYGSWTGVGQYSYATYGTGGGVAPVFSIRVETR